MNLPYRVVVSFAGSAVAIEIADVLIAEVVKFLIHPSLMDNDKTPQCTFYVQISNEEPKTYTLLQDSRKISDDISIGNLAEILQSKICYELANRSTSGLLFHAASLADGERGVLIPGGIGAGKSTLTSWLLSKGLGYMTDELVYVPFGSVEIQAFYRPLHLKHPTRSVMAGYDMDYGNARQLLSSSFSDLVAAETFTNQQITHAIPLKLALFPQYNVSGEFRWQKLSSAQTGQYLMQNLTNARNLPDHGFHEVARLARMLSGYEFQYNNFNQIENYLNDILAFRKG